MQPGAPADADGGDGEDVDGSVKRRKIDVRTAAGVRSKSWPSGRNVGVVSEVSRRLANLGCCDVVIVMKSFVKAVLARYGAGWAKN